MALYQQKTAVDSDKLIGKTWVKSDVNNQLFNPKSQKA